MIYLVSGHPRSGTNMMVKAMQAGGMKVLANRERIGAHERFSDVHYQVNPSGTFELGPRHYMRLPFLTWLAAASDFCLNMKFQALPLLPKGQYKVLFLWRDPEEIRQSMSAAFGEEIKQDFNHWYPVAMRIICDIMHCRRDVEMTEIQYREVIDRPTEVFESLGWPIDAKKAASVVDPDFYRFRKEELVYGA